MCDMSRKEILTEDLLFTKIGFIPQFNAIPGGDKDAVLYWMKKTYEFFYGNL